MVIAEAIMYIRVWALGGNTKKLGAALLAQFLGIHIAIYTVLGIFLRSVELIMIISIVIGFSRYKASNNRLLSVFHRDGIFYFVTLAGVTTANIIFDSVAPLEYKFMLAAYVLHPPRQNIDILTLSPLTSLSSQQSHSPQGCLHSILSCRLILHLHEFAEKELSTPESQQNKSSLQFAATAATELTADINSNRAPFKTENKEEC
ncbi:hypothetical protein EST38_g11062 [Candolleomyces aberdarensis]|uniref:Uncharacterized protein n=1 Tax=Candolleomyces aberdarensis TaxID=2316362 RepID=A0A4Q2D839_9AGAR|nr:hypothetical protein EST38_g11062 [Candolleomyces aberdarensis]